MWRWVAALVLLVLAGCTAPPTAGVSIPTYSPRREALSYFPADAPVVAIVRTDPQDPGLRRLASSGALRPLGRMLDAHGIHYEQLRGLLGNDAAIGQARAGGPPLAVLTTPDGEVLDDLARSRVAGGRALRAGTYRGTDLYAERGWAFGVRDRVLLVGGSVGALTEALDTRVGQHAFEAAQLNAVLPGDAAPAAFARGYVDLRAVVARSDPALRAIPLLKALGAAGFSVGATAEELRATLVAGIAGEGLTGVDLPLLARATGTRPMLPDDEPALAVADLGTLAEAAERALRQALPVTALRLDALRSRLRGAGVQLTPSLLSGPAAIVFSRKGALLRLQPARPRVLAETVARAARRLRSPRLRLTREGALLVARDRNRIVTRLGFVDGAFVAGRASPRELIALARQPLTALHSPALLRLPRAHRLYPRPVVLTLGGSPRRLRVDGFSGFAPRP
jgi:hypothetical protein